MEVASNRFKSLMGWDELGMLGVGNVDNMIKPEIFRKDIELPKDDFFLETSEVVLLGSGSRHCFDLRCQDVAGAVPTDTDGMPKGTNCCLALEKLEQDSLAEN